jgi:hypothetical protein
LVAESKCSETHTSPQPAPSFIAGRWPQHASTARGGARSIGSPPHWRPGQIPRASC